MAERFTSRGGLDFQGGSSGGGRAGDRQLHAGKLVGGGGAGWEFHDRTQEVPGLEEDGALFQLIQRRAGVPRGR